MVTAKDTKIQQELNLKNSLQIISPISRKVLSSVCQCLDPGTENNLGKKGLFQMQLQKAAIQHNRVSIVEVKVAEACSRGSQQVSQKAERSNRARSRCNFQRPSSTDLLLQLLESALEPSKQHNLRAQHSKHEPVEVT